MAKGTKGAQKRLTAAEKKLDDALYKVLLAEQDDFEEGDDDDDEEGETPFDLVEGLEDDDDDDEDEEGGLAAVDDEDEEDEEEDEEGESKECAKASRKASGSRGEGVEEGDAPFPRNDKEVKDKPAPVSFSQINVLEPEETLRKQFPRYFEAKQTTCEIHAGEWLGSGDVGFVNCEGS